jgi:hypothetical protein
MTPCLYYFRLIFSGYSQPPGRRSATLNPAGVRDSFRLIRNLVARFILQEKTLRALIHFASVYPENRSSFNENPIGRPSALFSEASGSRFPVDREDSFYSIHIKKTRSLAYAASIRTPACRPLSRRDRPIVFRSNTEDRSSTRPRSAP